VFLIAILCQLVAIWCS